MKRWLSFPAIALSLLVLSGTTMNVSDSANAHSNQVKSSESVTQQDDTSDKVAMDVISKQLTAAHISESTRTKLLDKANKLVSDYNESRLTRLKQDSLKLGITNESNLEPIRTPQELNIYMNQIINQGSDTWQKTVGKIIDDPQTNNADKIQLIGVLSNLHANKENIKYAQAILDSKDFSEMSAGSQLRSSTNELRTWVDKQMAISEINNLYQRYGTSLDDIAKISTDLNDANYTDIDSQMITNVQKDSIDKGIKELNNTLLTNFYKTANEEKSTDINIKFSNADIKKAFSDFNFNNTNYYLGNTLQDVLPKLDIYANSLNVNPVTPVGADITIKYRDDHGNTIKPDKIISGNLNEHYKAAAPTISGYLLKSSSNNIEGTFSYHPQTVIFTYSKIEANSFKKMSVYSLNHIYMYKNTKFKKNQRLQSYKKVSRTKRPMFTVVGHEYNVNNRLRYKVRDSNKNSRSYRRIGYITANKKFVAPTYYQTLHKEVKVITNRVNTYSNKQLSSKKLNHYTLGKNLKVKGFVRNGMTTRFILTNGHYITANKKFVIALK